MSGEEAAAMFPEPWPNLLPIGLRNFQSCQSFAGEEFETSLAVNGRQRRKFPLHFEQKDQTLEFPRT